MSLPAKWTIEDIMALTYMKGLNYPAIIKIVNRYGSFYDFLHTDIPTDIQSKIFQTSLFEDLFEKSREMAGQQICICQKLDVYPITPWDEDYPVLLKEIIYPPAVIFVKGRLQTSDSTAISVVGTRKCTTYGRLTAERFADSFARNGIIVVSGLAYGIDTESHLAAMKAQGITYAVIACGIDCISPPVSAKIADEIIQSGGAVISEYKCGIKALPLYFPQRNRIISGISKATIIIESGKKGGALITAQFAFDQQREVFAVPGNINAEKSMGTNLLIKRNLATPALSPEGMLDDLGITANMDSYKDGQTIQLFGEEEEMIFNNIKLEPLHIDEIAAKTGIEISQLLVKLLDLEFRNVVRQLPGKYYIRS